MGNMPTASELDSIFSSGNKNQQADESVNPTMTPSQDELSSIGQSNSDFSMTPDISFKSPITLGDRLRLSFADDRGKISELHKEFQYVEPKGNGNFLVGQSANDAVPLNSDSVFEDTISHIANNIGQIPAIAGQIAGATVGGTLGSALPGAGTAAGAIAGGGAGAVAGEAIKQGIGKILGVNQQTPEEMATDQVISGLFGSTGEALGLGVSKAAGKLLAMKAIGKGIETSANPSFATKQVASIFKVLGGVNPETTVRVLTEHGPEAAFTPLYTGKEYPSELGAKFVKNLVGRVNDLGTEVGAGDAWHKRLFGRGEFTIQKFHASPPNTNYTSVTDVYDDFINGLHDSGINQFGAGLKEDAKGILPRDNEQLKGIISKFFDKTTNEDGLITWHAREMSNAQALDAYKSLDSDLRGFWRQRDISVDKKLQMVTAKFKAGLKQALNDITLKSDDYVIDNVGNKTLKDGVIANNPFIRGRKNFSEFKRATEMLASQGGPDLTDISDLNRNVLNGRYLSKETGDFFRAYPDKSPDTKLAFENLASKTPDINKFTNMRGERIPLTGELQKYHDVQDLMKSNPSLMRISLVTSLMMLPGWPLLKMGIYEAASSPSTVMKGISLIKGLGQAIENAAKSKIASGITSTGRATLSQLMAKNFKGRS